MLFAYLRSLCKTQKDNDSYMVYAVKCILVLRVF